MTSAAVSASRPVLLYTEQLFYAALRQGNPSEARVEALAALALRHLSRSSETWAALRKMLMEQTDLDSATNRTLWYVIDALLKLAPHVFGPLLAPRLLEYTVQQLPWELTGYQGQTLQWFESMVLSWAHVLPQRLYVAIRQHAVQSRSGAELHGLLAAAQNPADDGTLASSADLQRLREAWDAVRYLGEEEAGNAAFQVRPTTAAVNGGEKDSDIGEGSPPGLGDVALMMAAQRDGNRQEGEKGSGTLSAADEDEYIPNFVEGAKPRELPKLELPKPRRRREARRRPREDDLGM